MTKVKINDIIIEVDEDIESVVVDGNTIKVRIKKLKENMLPSPPHTFPTYPRIPWHFEWPYQPYRFNDSGNTTTSTIVWNSSTCLDNALTNQEESTISF